MKLIEKTYINKLAEIYFSEIHPCEIIEIDKVSILDQHVRIIYTFNGKLTTSVISKDEFMIPIIIDRLRMLSVNFPDRYLRSRAEEIIGAAKAVM